MKLIKVKEISTKKGMTTMDKENLYLSIYELKGMVDSLSLLSEFDSSFHNPIIEQVSAKTDEICVLIQKGVLLESPRTQLEINNKGIGN